MLRPLKKPVIIGAGISGLCTAWNLSENGITVTVLEKTNEIGGLATSFNEDGFIFDLGPHNIHTIHRDILAFLKKTFGKDLVSHKLGIKLFFRNKFVTYPLSGIDVFTVLPLWTAIPAGISFLFARIKMFFRTPGNDNSFEKWIKNRFGGILYNIYFGSYAEKTWKIKASQISSYVAEKRVPVFSISDYLSRMIRKKAIYSHNEFSSSVDNYYLARGAGQIANYFAGQIREKKETIMNNVEITSINGKNNKIESVEYLQNGQQNKTETDFLFNTMPVNELINLLKLDIPREVTDAANRLEYCSEVLLYIKVSKSRVFDSALTYFSSPRTKFNRVYDIGAFSREYVPDGKTALCIEYTCNTGDEIWQASTEKLFNNAMSVFEKYKMLNRNEVIGYSTRKLSHAYPKFKIGFEQDLKTIFSYLESVENLITLGRQGLFCYANMDDALKMGFRSVELLNSMDKKGIDYSELFPKYVIM